MILMDLRNYKISNMPEDIIQKLEKAELKGRGGADFPTALKWKMVKDEVADKKFVVCNGSEGEPGVYKDGYILENYSGKVLEGINIALKTMGNSSGYIYLRKDYYDKFKDKFKALIDGLPIEVFKKTKGYLCGEETTLLESIEGKREEPRLRPPFPTQKGLFGYPTLVNNVETFYYVTKIAEDNYKKTRFYSIAWAGLPGGVIKKEPIRKGVYELSEDLTLEQILKETDNFPKHDFFLQVGGGASGKIFTKDDLGEKACGNGGIIIYNLEETGPYKLMEEWVSFFTKENCDKCVPCREGMHRLKEMLEGGKKIKKDVFEDIIFVLEKSSFCGLGKGVARVLGDFSEKILKNKT
jgi:NADH:ubiquinone oxidoreductase subunit F (NADH-binding)